MKEVLKGLISSINLIHNDKEYWDILEEHGISVDDIFDTSYKSFDEDKMNLKKDSMSIAKDLRKAIEEANYYNYGKESRTK